MWSNPVMFVTRQNIFGSRDNENLFVVSKLQDAKKLPSFFGLGKTFGNRSFANRALTVYMTHKHAMIIYFPNHITY